MNKVFVSDRIIGVYFTSVKNLEEYYKKATKIEGLSCGNIKEVDKDELNSYILANQTHKNNMWYGV